MTIFTEWITRIVLFLLLAMVTDAILPSGLMRKYARLVMSILLLLIFVGPLLQLLRIEPERMVESAQSKLEEELDAEALQGKIESKKNEILQGQNAYKLEQVTQALTAKLEKPLKEEHHLQLTDLQVKFMNTPYQMDTMDKLLITVSKPEEEQSVEEVEIAIADKESQKPEGQDEELVGWTANQLGLDKEKIEIRWEEEDE